MAYAAAISRLLRQAKCESFQAIQEDDGFVYVCGPCGASPELILDYARAIPEKYHVRLDPLEPDRVLIVSDRDHPSWEERQNTED